MPVEYSENEVPIRQKVGSLKEMTAARIASSDIPWRIYFEQLLEKEGEDYSNCVEEIRSNPSYYTVKPPKVRSSTRLNSHDVPDKKMFRAPTTVRINLLPNNHFHERQRVVLAEKRHQTFVSPFHFYYQSLPK